MKQALVILFTRLYTWMVRLYPSGFRAELGEDLIGTFRDVCRAAASQSQRRLLFVFLWEIWHYPAGLVSEYWFDFQRRIKEGGMNKGLEYKGIGKVGVPSIESSPQPDSWRTAMLAAAPHLYLMGITLLANFIPADNSQSSLRWIEILTLIVAWSGIGILMLISLAVAWRKKWPRWIASYYFYAFLAAAFPLLWLAQEKWHAYQLMNILMSLVYVLAFVMLAYGVLQRDAIKGLLMITPVAILSWWPVLEFIPAAFRNPLQVAMLTCTALAALLIARYGDWRSAIWILVGFTALLGAPIAYFRTFHHNIPTQYADPATILMLADRYSRALFWSAALVVAPLLLWFLGQLSRRGGRKAQRAYLLAFDGILLNLAVNLVAARGYSMRFIPYHLLVDGAFFLLIFVSAGVYLYGIFKLVKTARMEGLIDSYLTSAVFLYGASVLPLMFMFPMFDARSFSPSILPLGLFYENKVLGILYYGGGALWLILLAWLITRFRLPAQPEPEGADRVPVRDQQEMEAGEMHGLNPFRLEPTLKPGPANHRESLAAVFLFLSFGLAMIQMEIPHEWRTPSWLDNINLFLISGLLLPAIGFAVGWVKRFPRWSYAYVGVAFLMGWYMGAVTTPGLTLFGVPLFGRQHWGMRSWLPFCLALAIALLVSRSIRPVLALFANVWRDWTLASFSLFGCLPWLVLGVGYDEVENTFAFPFVVVSTVLFVIAAWLYMRSKDLYRRSLVLLVSTLIIWGLTTFATAIYWDGRLEPWMAEPDHWYLILPRMLLALLYLLVILFLPAVVGLFRATWGRERPV